MAGPMQGAEFFEDNRLELYNVKEDIGEKKNLADQLPDKTMELHGKLAAWRENIKAPMPSLKTPGEARLISPSKPR